MITTGRARTLRLAACLFALGSAACANGGVVSETSSTTSGAGDGGSVGRGGAGGDDDDDDGKSSTKSSGGSSDGGGGAGDGGRTSGEGGGGGDGGAAGTGSTASSSGSTTSTGTGDPCAMDSECWDGNPCTMETCGGPSGCVQTPIAVGQVGTTTEGATCDGVCQSDGACGLSLYQRAFAPGQAFTRQALSQAWTGANAPPPRGIAAVEKLYNRDALYVFSDDGQTFRRIGGVWQAPAQTATAFPGIEGTEIDCVMSWQPQPTGPAFMYFYTSGVARYAWSYSVDADYNVALAFGPFAQAGGGQPNEPPLGQFDCDVSFMHQYAYSDTQPWIDQWEGYNGSLWSFDGALGTWVAHGAQTTSPVWGNMPNGPAPGTTRDVYLDGNTLGFVAP